MELIFIKISEINLLIFKFLNYFKLSLLSLHQILWWDVRKLSEPTERLVLDPGREGNLDRALGAISLEFEATMVSFCPLFCLETSSFKAPVYYVVLVCPRPELTLVKSLVVSPNNCPSSC